jgi:hypothetical protein
VLEPIQIDDAICCNILGGFPLSSGELIQ